MIFSDVRTELTSNVSDVRTFVQLIYSGGQLLFEILDLAFEDASSASRTNADAGSSRNLKALAVSPRHLEHRWYSIVSRILAVLKLSEHM